MVEQGFRIEHQALIKIDDSEDYCAKVPCILK